MPYLLGVFATLCTNSFATEWVTDLPTAMARAQKENKAVLLNFTGSDWCGWCKKLKAEVFDTFDFGAYAAANLILVEVDFPHRKQLSAEQLTANHALADKYDIKGYPTIIVLDSDGRVLGRCGYVKGGPVAFVGRLEKFPGMPHKGGYLVSPPADSKASSIPNSAAVSARRSKAAMTPQPVAAPPPQYGELTLKGISGVGIHRVALINNEPMKVGEIARVKSFGTNIQVTLKEIRDGSVLIVVHGQTRELNMSRPPSQP